MSRWLLRDDVPRGDDYDQRWRDLADSGEGIHGEADLIGALSAGGSVLDAGCGTGRVAIELARRGHEVVGVDLDPGMLDTARAKAPELEWHLADLLDVDLARTFDLVALPGNVMIFLSPGTEADVVANMARHLAAGGRLVAG
ncbi:MAG: class I SAM-dependent methyltransferase, partial [Acidimicrobiaceae bacterium]